MNYELLVATNNAHKLQEIRRILSPHKITVYGMKDLNLSLPEINENGKDYFENALIKANALAKLTTMPIIADDSGLEIVALNHEPGIHTARYAEKLGGHHEAMQEIIKRLENKKRDAYFICNIVLVNQETKPLRFEGKSEGYIAYIEQGEGGFGYDPIFISKENHKSFATLSTKEKDLISHRGKALKKLLTYLKLNGLAK